MDVEEAKEKVMDFFSWEKVAESLPLLAGVAVGLIVVDKLLNIGEKLAPVYDKVKDWNSDGVFEIIDTVGDNIQLLDMIFKAFKVNVGDRNLDKIADFLQSLGTGGKHLSKLMGLVDIDKLLGGRSSGRRGGSGYKELRG